MLLNEKELKKRINNTHSNMKSRAKPKMWRRGRNKGKVRIPGIDELPFTKEQLWRHALNQVGNGIPCPYCCEAGKPFNMIDLSNCVFDHHVSLARGGTWELSNLEACCAECNLIKGKLTYEAFLATVQFIEAWHDPYDRLNMYACFRTQGVAHQFRRDKAKQPSQSVPAAVVAEVNSLEF